MLPGSTRSMVDARFLNPNLQLRVVGTPDPDASFNLNVCLSRLRQPVSVTIVSSLPPVVDSGAAAAVDGFTASTAGLLLVGRSVVEVLLAVDSFVVDAIGGSGAGAVLSVSSCGVPPSGEAPRSSLGVPPGRPAAIRIAAVTTPVIARPIARELPHRTGGVSGAGGASVAASDTGRFDRGCDFGCLRPSAIFRSDSRRSRWSAESTYRTRLAGLFDFFGFFAGTGILPVMFSEGSDDHGANPVPRPDAPTALVKG